MKVQGALLSGLALGLVLTGSVDAKTSTHMPASSWEIGPIINGRNYSLALPGPSQLGDDFGLTISPNAEPHYVTFSHGSLRGKTQIRMRYRVDGPRGAVIHGAKRSTGSP